MPNMAVGQRLLVTAVGTYFGQRTMNTFLYRVATVAGTIDSIDFIDALHAVFIASGGLLKRYVACVPEDIWLPVATWYQVVGPVRYRKVVRSIPAAEYVGGSTTQNLQASITRYGEFGLRTAVGGIRVPMPSTESIEGLLTNTYKATLLSLANEMADTQTAGSPLVTIIPQVGVPGYTNDTPPVRIPVTNSQDCVDTAVQETTRVIRRRTVRVGE